jgi:hypothetical protein
MISSIFFLFSSILIPLIEKVLVTFSTITKRATDFHNLTKLDTN